MSRRINNSRRSTIKDVASLAGVSVSTVSSVINKSRFVNPEKVEKVNWAIDKLDYKINPIARGLRKNSLNAIGVIVPDIAELFYAQVIAGMEGAAKERGYTLILGCTFYDKEEEESQVKILLNQSVDGIIFFSGSDNTDIIQKVKDTGIPILLVDRQVNDKDISSILVDNRKAMERLVDYLVGMGHKRIAYLTMNIDKQTTIKNRFQGYLDSLKKHGIEFDEKLIIKDSEVRFDPMRRTYALIVDFLKTNDDVTAIISIADFMAMGAIKAIMDNGLKIPDDISVTGFNDDSICEYIYPSLTSIKQPKKSMGRAAVDLLADIVEGKTKRNKSILFPVNLVERDSVKKID